MDKENKSIKEIINHFKSFEKDYKCLMNEVESKLNDQLKQANIKISSITSRIKEYDSLEDKIKEKKYSDPINDIKDFAGVRIVCIYERDYGIIEDIIYKLFHVHEKEDKTVYLGVDKMGYNGIHYVVSSHKKDNIQLIDYSERIRCEIQLRTALHDSWAITSHHLSYKNKKGIPENIQRDLNNVAILLEVSQQVFDRIRSEIDEYIKRIGKDILEDNILTQKIDYETLKAYTKWKYPELPVSEKWQHRLLSDLNYSKYKTLYDIDIAVERAKEAVKSYKEENPSWFKSGTGHITKALGFTDPEFRKKHPFGGKTRAAFKKYGSQIKE